MKYSIIIPTYNNEETIERAINSVFMQDSKEYELIIVNDASTDNTENIILQQIKNKENVKFINLEKNKKAGGARNEGINIAKGEYIVFLDSDDILKKDAIKKIDKTIGKDIPDIVYLGFQMNEQEIIPDEKNSIKQNRLSNWKYENVWDICWNKKFLNKNNLHFIENKYFEDFLFYYKGIILSNTYKVLSEVTHIYTEDRKESITTGISIQKLEDMYNNVKLLLQFAKKMPKEYEECLLDFIYRNNNYINILINKYTR